MHMNDCPIDIIPGSDCCCADALADMGLEVPVEKPEGVCDCCVHVEDDCLCDCQEIDYSAHDDILDQLCEACQVSYNRDCNCLRELV
jgi:hypothetical protein